MIDEVVFKSKLESLFAFYGKKPPLPMHFEVYLNRVKHRTTADFVEGCQECMCSQTKFLPSPNELDGYVEQVQSRRATLEKRAEHTAAVQVQTPLARDSEYFRAAKELFHKRFITGELDSEKLADAMYKMETKYPGRGWWGCANRVMFGVYVRSGVAPVEAIKILPRQSRTLYS